MREVLDLTEQAGVTAVTIPTWTIATSHLNFSGSAGRTRSRSAWRHIGTTSTFTTGMRGWVRAVDEILGTHNAEAPR